MQSYKVHAILISVLKLLLNEYVRIESGLNNSRYILLHIFLSRNILIAHCLKSFLIVFESRYFNGTTLILVCQTDLIKYRHFMDNSEQIWSEIFESFTQCHGCKMHQKYHEFVRECLNITHQPEGLNSAFVLSNIIDIMIKKGKCILS